MMENPFFTLSTKQGLANDQIRAMVEDSHGNLWFGTWGGGVSRYDGNTLTTYSEKQGLVNNQVRTIIEDSRGNLWFGTNGGGVSQFDGHHFTSLTQKDGLPNNSILSIIEDNQSNIWFATYGGGIARFNINSFTSYSQKEGLAYRQVRAIIEDKNNDLWFGTEGGGVTKYDGQSFTTFTEKEGLSGKRVRAIVEDSHGALWFGTDGGGVSRYINDIFTTFTVNEGLANNTVWSIVEDKSGQLWFATEDGGVSRYNGKSFTTFTKENGLAAKTILSMIEDQDGNMWFGSDGGGVSRYDGNSFTTFTVEDGLASNIIWSIFEDSAGTLWFGTDGGGISRFNGKTFTTYTEKNGLASNYVYSITEDKKGNIWLGTEKGLNYLKLTNNGAKVSIVLNDQEQLPIFFFGKQDGLKAEDFFSNSILIDHNNNMWLGGGKALTMLDLDKFELPVESPQVRINTLEVEEVFWDFHSSTQKEHALRFSQIQYSGVEDFYNLPKDLQLPYNLNDLTFHFSAIDWTAPHKIEYQYMLEGFDNSWSKLTKETKAQYRNIPYGTFSFKVRAIGAAKTWTDTIDYKFTVHPPWWFTWWAILLFSFLFLVVVSIATHLRIKQVNKRQLEVHKARMNAELITKKNELFAHVSHEFRTPLTLVIGPVNNILRHIKGSETKKALTMVSANAKRLLRMVDQLLDLARLDNNQVKEQQQVDFSYLIKRTYASLYSLFEGKEISTSLNLDKGLMVNISIDSAEKIIINLLSNAVKYTPLGGVVDISCQSTEDELVFIVKDNGFGIALDQQEKIFERFVRANNDNIEHISGAGIGLALVKELVESVKGNIQVSSQLTQGSEFRVTMPLIDASQLVEQLVRSKDLAPTLVVSGNEQQTLVEQEIELLNEIDQKQQKQNNLQSSQHVGLTPETVTSDSIAINKPQVLIVEDYKDMQIYIIECLELEYECIVADNGEQGIKVALEVIPDLIITDLMMPKRNGYELARTLRNDIKTSHIPILMLTAKGDDESRLEAWKTDIDEYMAKPFNQEELVLRIRNLLNIRKLMSQRLQGVINSSESEVFNKQLNTKDEINNTRLAGLSGRDKNFITKLEQLVAKQYENSELNAKSLFSALAMSERQFHRKMKALLSQTFSDYLRAYRLKMAAVMLLDDVTITRTALDCGFSSASYFSLCFKAQYGMSPTKYKPVD